ncbi:unnamed protein product [Chrysoparadoxa australica]
MAPQGEQFSPSPMPRDVADEAALEFVAPSPSQVGDIVGRRTALFPHAPTEAPAAEMVRAPAVTARRATIPAPVAALAPAGTTWCMGDLESDPQKPEPFSDLKQFIRNGIQGGDTDIYVMAAISSDPAAKTKTDLPLFRQNESTFLHHLALTSASSRAIMSVWLQIGVTVLVLAQTLRNDEKGWCTMSPWEETFMTKICGSSFCLFLWMNFVRLLARDVEHNRIIQAYLSGRVVDCLKCSNWLVIGIWSNFISIILMTWTSLAVIYSSRTALDIILKTMALRYVNDLDDAVVTTYDREAALKELNESDPDPASITRERSQVSQACLLSPTPACETYPSLSSTSLSLGRTSLRRPAGTWITFLVYPCLWALPWLFLLPPSSFWFAVSFGPSFVSWGAGRRAEAPTQPLHYTTLGYWAGHA